MSDTPLLRISNIRKSFVMTENQESLIVLQGISLDVKKGEFVCLLGHSGCGKSTLLRIVAGLESKEEGEIVLEGIPQVRPCKDVLMLFQDFNQLFPWLTVHQNVMYPLKRIHTSLTKKDISKKAEDILEAVGLSKFRNSYPHELSGGMKQRVAVARALIVEPKILLMDEPFAALDAMTRATLQELTKTICKKKEVAALFVTHSVEEAVLMGDRIVIMNHRTGQIDRILDNHNRDQRGREETAALTETIISLLS